MSQRGGVKSLSLGNSHRRSLCKSSFQQEKIWLSLWARWSRPHMSLSRSRQPTPVPRWAKYGPPPWWCRIRWSWSTIMMIILIISIGKNVINRAGDLPMDDVHLQNLTGLETGGFWSLDCLKRLDRAFYKILVCGLRIYLFLCFFPQNSFLFYPNWPGDKLLVMLWPVFSEQGHSLHSAKF